MYVSSDSQEILNLAKQDGIIIHKRELEIATDSSSVIDTVEVVLKEAESKFLVTYDVILLLQPTSPIRTGADIDTAIDCLLQSDEINTVISVCEMKDIHPARMYNNESGVLIPLNDTFEQVRRQDIPPVFYRNGAIYLTKRRAFLKHKSLMSKPIKPYIMPYDQMLNIDEPRDIKLAEVLINDWLK